MKPRRRILRAVLLGLAMTLVQACASGPPPTPTEQGYLALAQRDWLQASAHFETALRTDSANGRAWLGKTRAELGQRNPEAALGSLSRLAKADAELFRGEAQPSYADALAASIPFRIDRRQHAAALAAARALRAVEPDRRGLDRLFGAALLAEAGRQLQTGDREAALGLYREACGVVPQRLEAWVGAAEILLVSGRGKEAVRLIEAARPYHPTAGALRTLTLQALRAR